MRVFNLLSISRLGLAVLVAAGLAGCGGGDSGGGGAPAGGGGTVSSGVPNGVIAPAGGSTVATPSIAFSALDGGNVASIGSPLQINFTVIDNGAVVPMSKIVASFAVAKWVPGTGTAPAEWVNYIYAHPTITAGSTAVPKDIGSGRTGAPTGAALLSAWQANTDTGGTLTDSGKGFYTYTFKTDIKTNTSNPDGASYWDPAATHRVAIQLGYTDSTGKYVTSNPTYDFTWTCDASGHCVSTPVAQRQVVDAASCRECHQYSEGHDASAARLPVTFTGLAVHGGSRVDPLYCVMCHNSKTTDPNSGNVLDLKNMAHKIHMGAELTKTYTIWGYQDSVNGYNDVKFPQDLRNCTKCHDGSANATHKTPQGDNWKNVPSRAACGACHDGINFATGLGTTLDGNANGKNGHVGGAQADDSKCALCHNAGNIPIYHIPVTPPYAGNSFDVAGGNANSNAAWIASNTKNLPTGAITVSYDLKSVSRDANKHPVMVFRMLQNGVAVPFNDKAAKTEIWDNFIGSPSVYFVYSVPQDGIAAPADFNVSTSGYLRSLWNGTSSGTGAGTLTGPDANGYYTATLTGSIVPDNAVMFTGGLGYTYSLSSTQPLTQSNVTGYPLRACGVAANGNKCGGLIVAADDVQMVATGGYTGRRTIVDNAKCNLCHEQLGEFTDEAFHAGQRNDGTTCAWCHRPNQTSSGWSADSTNFIHGIHGASKRTVPFTWHAASSADNFSDVGFPTALKNCETCHVPGSYDFSAAANLAAVPNRLYRTVATGTLTAATAVSNSPYITVGTNYGTGFSFNAGTGVTTEAAGTTLVNSPIATACFSCHDGDLAAQPGTTVQEHIEQLGLGSIYEPRSTALARSEQCLLCHGANSTIAPIKAMHAK
jgi:OmcA/MtrC family decaheme c-type cytochrome